MIFSHNFPVKLKHLSLFGNFGSFMLELFSQASTISVFWCKIIFWSLVAQLENNPKSIAQPKVFPLHRFEFAKLVLVSAIGTLELRILAQERTLLEGQKHPRYSTGMDTKHCNGCDDVNMGLWW